MEAHRRGCKGGWGTTLGRNESLGAHLLVWPTPALDHLPDGRALQAGVPPVEVLVERHGPCAMMTQFLMLLFRNPTKHTQIVSIRFHKHMTPLHCAMLKGGKQTTSKPERWGRFWGKYFCIVITMDPASGGSTPKPNDNRRGDNDNTKMTISGEGTSGLRKTMRGDCKRTADIAEKFRKIAKIAVLVVHFCWGGQKHNFCRIATLVVFYAVIRTSSNKKNIQKNMISILDNLNIWSLLAGKNKNMTKIFGLG